MGKPPDPELPTAIIQTVSEAQTNETISFSSDESSDPDGQITQYLWEFGDGTTSTTPNPTHQFSQSGSYAVRLTVTDNDGNSDSASALIVITDLSENGGLPSDCIVKAKISGGRLEASTPACLANQSTIWLSIEGVNQHPSMAITAGNGLGEVKLEYSNFGWPNEQGSNLHGWSDNPGTQECITLGGQANYWGYLKVSGSFENVAIAVDFDTPTCRN